MSFWKLLSGRNEFGIPISNNDAGCMVEARFQREVDLGPVVLKKNNMQAVIYFTVSFSDQAKTASMY